MPAAYFDSSVLLSVLLNESRAEVCSPIWNEQKMRVSSILLSAECWTGARRHFLRMGIGIQAKWKEERIAFLEKALNLVELKSVDSEIVDTLKKNPKLADCRTLDALHLATAMFFRDQADSDLLFVTLDSRLRETALKFGFKVLPE